MNLSLEKSEYLYLCFQLALFHSVSYFFSLYQSLSSCFCTGLDVISSSTIEVPSINPSANVFVYGDFHVHHKESLTYSSGTDRQWYLFYRGFLLIRKLWSCDHDHVYFRLKRGCSFLLYRWLIIFMLIEVVFVIIKEMFHGRMSVKSIPLLLLVMNFVSGYRLELILTSFIKNIRPSLIHIYGFQLLVLLP